MPRPVSFLAALLWVLIPSTPARAQDQSQDPPQPQPSLADVARQAGKDKEKNAAKPKTVITDDTLPSSKGLGGLALGDLSNSQGGGNGSAMDNALARLDEAESELNKLDTLDRTTLAKAVLMDNDVDFPNRRNWEGKIFAAKEHYVSHERELITEAKKLMAQVESWRASQGGQKLDPNDPRVQKLKSRVAEIIQDALRTEQDYRAVVMEGWDLARQAKH